MVFLKESFGSLQKPKDSFKNTKIIQQSWITIRNATFDASKNFIGPVHLLPRTDKWDYIRSSIIEKKIVSCFDIGEVPKSPGKWNWNLLYFFPSIFTFEQCVPNRRLEFKILKTDYKLKT